VRRVTPLMLLGLVTALTGCLLFAARSQVAVWLLTAVEAKTGSTASVGSVTVGDLSEFPALTPVFEDVVLASEGSHRGLD
jgi:hypothetical protein